MDLRMRLVMFFCLVSLGLGAQAPVPLGPDSRYPQVYRNANYFSKHSTLQVTKVWNDRPAMILPKSYTSSIKKYPGIQVSDMYFPTAQPLVGGAIWSLTVEQSNALRPLSIRPFPFFTDLFPFGLR